MKNVCKLIALVGMLIPLTAHAQLTIPGTRVEFNLDGNTWRYLRTLKTPDNADLYLYCYIGEVFTDSRGDTVIPYLRIYVNQKYDGDLYDLVYDRYSEHPYQSIDEYSHGPGLPKSGGLGYMGLYTNPSDHKTYQFYMTYFKDRKALVEFRLETTADTFEEMEPVFNTILKSVK